MDCRVNNSWNLFTKVVVNRNVNRRNIYRTNHIAVLQYTIQSNNTVLVHLYPITIHSKRQFDVVLICYCVFVSERISTLTELVETLQSSNKDTQTSNGDIMMYKVKGKRIYDNRNMKLFNNDSSGGWHLAPVGGIPFRQQL